MVLATDTVRYSTTRHLQTSRIHPKASAAFASIPMGSFGASNQSAKSKNVRCTAPVRSKKYVNDDGGGTGCKCYRGPHEACLATTIASETSARRRDATLPILP